MSLQSPQEFKQQVMDHLHRMLSEIEAFPVLPEPSSEEAAAMGEAWGTTFQEIKDKEYAAVHVTLLLLSPDVRALVDDIKAAAHIRLMGKDA